MTVKKLRRALSPVRRDATIAPGFNVHGKACAVFAEEYAGHDVGLLVCPPEAPDLWISLPLPSSGKGVYVDDLNALLATMDSRAHVVLGINADGMVRMFTPGVGSAPLGLVIRFTNGQEQWVDFPPQVPEPQFSV